MEKPLGKGTPNRAGYCNRQPSTKQQKVVIGSASLPSRKQPQEPSLLRRDKSSEAAGQGEWKGFGPLRAQGRKPSVCARESQSRRTFPKVASVLVVPPQRAGKVKELNKQVVC